MTDVPVRIARVAWHLLPGRLRRLLRTEGGRRLIRFAPAAVLALCATQLTYLICQLAGVTAGISGAAGWFAGAAVSYVVSRWAWERKGRPDLLRETLPFWTVSICVGVVLTLSSKAASHEAMVLGLHGVQAHAFKQGIYFAANCLTFAARFTIFHYVLFADRGPVPPPAELPDPGQVAAGSAQAAPDQFALAAERPTEPRARR